MFNSGLILGQCIDPLYAISLDINVNWFTEKFLVLPFCNVIFSLLSLPLYCPH